MTRTTKTFQKLGDVNYERVDAVKSVGAGVGHMPVVDPVELATKLIWAALQMKRQYRTAGMCVARVYCEAVGLNCDRIEHAIIRVVAMRGGNGTLEEATSEVRQSLGGEAT